MEISPKNLKRIKLPFRGTCRIFSPPPVSPLRNLLVFVKNYTQRVPKGKRWLQRNEPQNKPENDVG